MGNVPDNQNDQYNLYDDDSVPDIIESRCSGAEKCKEDYIIIPNVIPTVHTASYDRYGLKQIQKLLMSSLDSVVSTSPLRAGQTPTSPLWLVTSHSRWVIQSSETNVTSAYFVEGESRHKHCLCWSSSRCRGWGWIPAQLQTIGWKLLILILIPPFSLEKRLQLCLKRKWEN